MCANSKYFIWINAFKIKILIQNEMSRIGVESMHEILLT